MENIVQMKKRHYKEENELKQSCKHERIRNVVDGWRQCVDCGFLVQGTEHDKEPNVDW